MASLPHGRHRWRCVSDTARHQLVTGGYVPHPHPPESSGLTCNSRLPAPTLTGSLVCRINYEILCIFGAATSGLVDPQPLMNGCQGLFSVSSRWFVWPTCLKSMFSRVDCDIPPAPCLVRPLPRQLLGAGTVSQMHPCRLTGALMSRTQWAALGARP